MATNATQGVLVASTVATATISGTNAVVVSNVDGAARISFTVDGTTPVADADETYTLPACICSKRITGSRVTTVKLISAGTPRYSVEAG